jgi:DUF4097 and DUF4098 domain-containing protein YvlB
MKKTCSLLLFASLVISANAQFNAEKTPLITKSLSADNIKSILAETSGGSISVTGVNASEAKIEVYVIPNNYRKNDLSESEIRERMASEYKLTVEAGNNKLTAIAEPKDMKMDWKKALNFSFKIFVPKNVSTDLSTSGGSISLKNLSGDLKFRTSGGSLNVEDVGGKIDGGTSGGSIHLENSKADEAELTTSGGSIDARNSEGKLRLSTSGGSLSLIDLKGDIKATTSGGSIDGRNVHGELVTHTSGGSVHLEDMYCSLEASTSGGNIDVSIKEIGKYVRLDNSAGSVDLELPKGTGVDLDLSADKIKTDHLENFTGKMEEDRVEGKLNGGGSIVKVKAGSGKIYLKLK